MRELKYLPHNQSEMTPNDKHIFQWICENATKEKNHCKGNMFHHTIHCVLMNSNQ